MKFKRIIIVLLIIPVILFTCSFSVSAAENDLKQYINGMDYLSDFFYHNSHSGFNFYYLYFTEDMFGSVVDIVVETKNGIVNGCFMVDEETTNRFPLSVTSITKYLNDGSVNHLVRLTGYLPEDLQSREFRLDIGVDVESTELNLLSCRFYPYLEFIEFASIDMGSGDNLAFGDYYGDFTSLSLPTGADPLDFKCRVHLPFTSWMQYDFMQFDLAVHCNSINNIYVTCGEYNVPFEVKSVVESSESFSSLKYVSLLVDLRNLPLTDDNTLSVVLGCSSTDNSSLFGVLGVSGFVNIEISSPEVSWFRALLNSINEGFDYISVSISNLRYRLDTTLKEGFASLQNIFTGGEAGEEFLEDAEQKREELDNAQDQLDSVEKPDISDSGDISIIVDSGTTSAYGNVFSVLLSSDLLLNILLLMCTFMLAGYVLFGKK